MDTVYLVWVICDDMEPGLIAVATSPDKADKVVEVCKLHFEDAFEYKITTHQTNTFAIDEELFKL